MTYLTASEPSLYAPGTVIEPIQITEIPTLDDGSPDPDEIEKNLPVVIDPSELLENTGKTTVSEALVDVMDKLASGEMTYEEYKDAIWTEMQPTPDPDPEPDPTPGGSGDGDTEVKTGLAKLVDFFTGTTYVESPLDAINFGTLFECFPFNIPAGIYEAINFWSAEGSAPTLVFPTLAISDGKVSGDEFTVNLADMPGMAQIAALIRAGELILFVIGLAILTRKVTKW